MLTKKTTLVLGAGASNCYDFPLGKELKFKICNNLENEKSVFWTTLTGLGFERGHINAFREDLEDSGLPSVDIFLSNRPGYRDIGKAVIASSLIPFENDKALRTTISNSSEHWYDDFFNGLGMIPQDFFRSAKNLSIITFNYDRSLEFTLRARLRAAFNQTNEEVQEFFRAFKLIHVYGKLGEPSFLLPEGRPFVPDVSVSSVAKSMKKILQFDELNSLPEAPLIQKCIDSADLICFLGFGFHKLNLSRLGIVEVGSDEGKATVLGTTFGLEPSDLNVLQKYFPKRAVWADETIPDFLRKKKSIIFD